MAENTRLQTAERLFLMLVVLVLSGMAGAMGVAPFKQLAEGATATMTMVRLRMLDRSLILEPIVHPGKGLVTNDAAHVQPGYTMIQGIMPGGHQVRMLDAQGREVHRWKLDFYKAWPDAAEMIPAKRIPVSEFQYINQGMWPLPDGSLIANFTALGSVRVDACSNVMWRSDRPTHHSVTPTDDGKFWIPSHIDAKDTPREWMPFGEDPQEIDDMINTDHYYHDSVVLMTADGKIEKQFSVLGAIVEAGLEGPIYQSLAEKITDATHINDINIVTGPLAEKIQGVEPGDLLLSLRAMNMLIILDQQTGQLKWHKQGAWVRQHDPDIMPDGTIEMFNNRSPMVVGTHKGSEILSFDPATETTRVIYPKSEDDWFQSNIMGTHQRLENGNELIVESMAGRAFEVTPTGKIVWDYRLPYDSEHASLFSSGMRVPLDYFEKDSLKCPS
ncbi:arylsulfotransferase family protein [Altererythrobacter sp.]|uniref:arylsulfotransferase family protein n=1 Tax=Altererythrobacter sp. TaxID=1872480 RepID=UPI003D0750F4